MNASTAIESGRVIRLGLGWADVTIDNRTVRVRVPPDRVLHIGNTVRVVSKQVLDTVPAQAAKR